MFTSHDCQTLCTTTTVKRKQGLLCIAVLGGGSGASICWAAAQGVQSTKQLARLYAPRQHRVPAESIAHRTGYAIEQAKGIVTVASAVVKVHALGNVCTLSLQVTS